MRLQFFFFWCSCLFCFPFVVAKSMDVCLFDEVSVSLLITLFIVHAVGSLPTTLYSVVIFGVAQLQ